jgi:uncharacterized membrane protein
MDAAGSPGGIAANGAGEEAEMAEVEKSVEVEVPVRTAYDQWTQFEAFPRFMEGVHEVRQLDDTRLHWRAAVAGKEAEWDAVITEQTPDRIVAWRSTTGRPNNGAVTFEPLGSDRTRVTARIEYDPEGIVESAGDALGFMDRRVADDLDRFKAFIEGRGTETGAWRGEIHGEQAAGGTASD